MKKFLPLFILCLSFAILTWGFALKRQPESEELPRLANTNPATVMSSDQEEQTEETVPELGPSDLIKLFFSLINEHQSEAALKLMSANLQGDQTSQDQWQKQFQAVRWANVESLELLSDDENKLEQQYRVAIDIDVIADETAPIPFYGWGDNPNWRWIRVEKNESNLWQISDIATGP